MSPTSASTTPSSAGRTPEEQYRVVRKRNRVPLSCYPCRNRKKCDRSQPCSNCTKREGVNTNSCSYAAPVARKRNQSQNTSSSPDDMQNRIDRLEGLVLSLMHGGANIDASSAAAAAAAGASASVSASSADNRAGSVTDSGSSMKRGGEADEDGTMRYDDGGGEGGGGGEESDTDDGLTASLGMLKVDTKIGKSMYIGSESWHAILADIAEVKNYFASHKKDLENQYNEIVQSKPLIAREGPTLLMGCKALTEVELRAELPPKSSVLILCSRYFNSMDNAVNIIHAPYFQQQLRNHWQDPSKTPIMWLGMLYSVLCLAMLSYHKVGDEPLEWKGRSLDLAAEYRVRTVQCLIAGDYTKPVEYTVETMMLYVFGEFSSRWDADYGLWLVASLIVRTAMRMGYHRDAKWFPSITPFQAEMRRRTWALVRMADVIFSHQVSLPNMVFESDCDAQLPSNIFDEEFGPETKVLPPSRPQNEPTPISYMIAKVKLCLELGNILQATNRVGKQVPYDDILRFDQRLRDLEAELPPHLRMRPLEGCYDPLTLIIARFNIDVLSRKIMCLLHRKYLPRARHNPRYAHSRRSAIEASLETLHHLEILHRESQPNGRLRSISWYVKSIATKDFLLPAMLVILDLHADNEARRTGQRQDSQTLMFWTPEQRAEMIKVVEQTRDMWSELQSTSMEATKASNIMTLLLEKINAGRDAQAADADANVAEKANLFTSMDPGDMQPEHSAAVTLGMLSGAGGVTPGGDTGFGTVQSPGGTNYPAMDLSLAAQAAGERSGLTPDFSGGAEMLSLANPGSPLSMFDNLGSSMELSTNFDWNAFETFTQTANWGPDQSFQFYSGTGEQQPPQPQPQPQQPESSSGSFSAGFTPSNTSGRS